MSQDAIILQCPACGTKNRIPREKRAVPAKCGKCKKTLPQVMTKPLDVTDATFAKEVLQSPIPVMVDFWAAWCGPCRMVAPDLEKIADTYAGKMKVVKVNVDENQMTAAKYSIQSIPSLFVFKNGQILEQQAGALPYPHLQRLAERAIR